MINSNLKRVAVMKRGKGLFNEEKPSVLKK